MSFTKQIRGCPSSFSTTVFPIRIDLGPTPVLPSPEEPVRLPSHTPEQAYALGRADYAADDSSGPRPRNVGGDLAPGLKSRSILRAIKEYLRGWKDAMREAYENARNRGRVPAFSEERRATAEESMSFTKQIRSFSDVPAAKFAGYSPPTPEEAWQKGWDDYRQHHLGRSHQPDHPYPTDIGRAMPGAPDTAATEVLVSEYVKGWRAAKAEAWAERVRHAEDRGQSPLDSPYFSDVPTAPLQELAETVGALRDQIAARMADEDVCSCGADKLNAADPAVRAGGYPHEHHVSCPLWTPGHLPAWYVEGLDERPEKSPRRYSFSDKIGARMADEDRHVTLWSRSASGDYWVVERSYTLEHVNKALGFAGLKEKTNAEGRVFSWFEKGEDPNAGRPASPPSLPMAPYGGLSDQIGARMAANPSASYPTFTDATRAARQYITDSGYRPADVGVFGGEGIWDRKVDLQGRPAEGQTVRIDMPLEKDGGGPYRALHVQIYGQATGYELNAYIS